MICHVKHLIFNFPFYSVECTIAAGKRRGGGGFIKLCDNSLFSVAAECIILIQMIYFNICNRLKFFTPPTCLQWVDPFTVKRKDNPILVLFLW